MTEIFPQAQGLHPNPIGSIGIIYFHKLGHNIITSLETYCYM